MIDSAVKTKTGKENIKAYQFDDVIPFPILHFKELQRNHKIYKYATEYITLDTETSKSGQIDEELQVYMEMREHFVSMTKGTVIKLTAQDFANYGLTDTTIRSLNNEVSFLHSLKFSNISELKKSAIISQSHSPIKQKIPLRKIKVACFWQAAFLIRNEELGIRVCF